MNHQEKFSPFLLVKESFYNVRHHLHDWMIIGSTPFALSLLSHVVHYFMKNAPAASLLSLILQELGYFLLAINGYRYLQFNEKPSGWFHFTNLSYILKTIPLISGFLTIGGICFIFLYYMLSGDLQFQNAASIGLSIFIISPFATYFFLRAYFWLLEICHDHPAPFQQSWRITEGRILKLLFLSVILGIVSFSIFLPVTLLQSFFGTVAMPITALISLMVNILFIDVTVRTYRYFYQVQ